MLFPALTGPLFPLTLAGNATANLVRNMWAFTIIFCGHFPAGVATFSEEETEDETRGAWYFRQLLGSANITGGKLFHIMTGNLSHQIEHHLFPDLPAHRYPEIAGEVARSASATACRTTPARSASSCAAWRSKICRLALPDAAADAHGRRTAGGPRRPSPREDGRMKDHLTRGEIRKDAVQSDGRGRRLAPSAR